MVRWIFVTILLTIDCPWSVNGFLFTPKFQLFLNQMQQSGQKDFVLTWDFNKQNNFNQGFTYATNHNGKIYLLRVQCFFCDKAQKM